MRRRDVEVDRRTGLQGEEAALDRVLVRGRALRAGDGARDDVDRHARELRGRPVPAPEVLVVGVDHLPARRQVQPQLQRVHVLVPERQLAVDDPAPGRHPLHVARAAGHPSCRRCHRAPGHRRGPESPSRSRGADATRSPARRTSPRRASGTDRSRGGPRHDDDRLVVDLGVGADADLVLDAVDASGRRAHPASVAPGRMADVRAVVFDEFGGVPAGADRRRARRRPRREPSSGSRRRGCAAATGTAGWATTPTSDCRTCPATSSPASSSRSGRTCATGFREIGSPSPFVCACGECPACAGRRAAGLRAADPAGLHP